MKYAFICSNAARYPVNHLCRLLGVKRSAYYSWRGRPAKSIGPEERALRRRMKALFVESRGSLGSRMMTANLRLEGFMVGRERVRDLMKAGFKGQTETQIPDHDGLAARSSYR